MLDDVKCMLNAHVMVGWKIRIIWLEVDIKLHPCMRP